PVLFNQIGFWYELDWLGSVRTKPRREASRRETAMHSSDFTPPPRLGIRSACPKTSLKLPPPPRGARGPPRSVAWARPRPHLRQHHEWPLVLPRHSHSRQSMELSTQLSGPYRH